MSKGYSGKILPRILQKDIKVRAVYSLLLPQQLAFSISHPYLSLFQNKRKPDSNDTFALA